MKTFSTSLSFAAGFPSESALADEAAAAVARFAETLPDMVYLFDLAEQRFVFANQGMETLLGYTTSELIAMGTDAAAVLFHPADLPRVARTLQSFASLAAASSAAFAADNDHLQAVENEYRFVHANGVSRRLLCREAPYRRDPQTGRVRQIIGIARETEQPVLNSALNLNKESDKPKTGSISPAALSVALTEAEAARLTAEAARQDAEASERKLRLALEAASMAAWDWDCALIRDPFTSDLTRIPITGQGAVFHWVGDFLAHVHADDQDSLRAALCRALATPQRPEFETEYRLRLPGTTVFRWNAARGYAVHEEGTGRPLRLTGVRWDIEDRKREETRLAAEARKQTHIAETLQRSLLPPLVADRFPAVELYSRYEAALEEARLGGDFFDAMPLGGDRIALVVGDVSGKGLTAATRTAEVKFRLRALLREFPSPVEALTRLNRQLYEERRDETGPEREAFVALCAAVLDTRTGGLSIAVAGIEPPLILRTASLPRRAERFDCGGLPLGLLPDWEQENGAVCSCESLHLLPGDVLMLYTDGLAEAPGADGKDIFGTSRLLRAVARALASKSPPAARSGAVPPPLHAVGDSLIAEVSAFTGSGPAQDDICLLLARFQPA